MQAQTALRSYADPDWACAEGWPLFADRLLELARAAEPGSDHQLAYVNALCTSVLALRHVAVLAALLDTDPAEHGLPGLIVDTDLRWRIVTALAAAGDIDNDGQATPFIDAEAERDPTAAGKRNAARAAAARPQIAVKNTAWQLVIEDDTLPNIVGRAIIDGFVQPGQQALLQPFTAKYFDAIPRVWERRSSEVAQTVVIGLYPSWDISEDGAGRRRPVPGRRAAAVAAAAGARRPRRRRTRAAGPGLRRQLGQGGETPALITLIALIEAGHQVAVVERRRRAAFTPSGADSSMPRPCTSEP